jgi:hypothetical protein
MGPEFEKKTDKSLYYGLKFVLFHEGIIVDIGSHIDNGRLFIMRKATPEDKLPQALAKVLEPPEEEMPEPGREEEE